MPLSYADRASLALRMVGARYLDDSEASGSQAVALAFDSARGKIVSRVKDAPLRVRDCATLASHLRGAAIDLREVAKATPVATIDAAAAQFERIAASVYPGNGDGPASLVANGAPRCCCGVLDLAAVIEQEVRQAYSQAAKLSASIPAITYETWLVAAGNRSDNLQHFHVAAEADIRQAPRMIKVEIRNHDLSGKELCQLAYQTFHELVCHGFQTGHLPSAKENAHPTCHWSEGWMDSIACEMALNWVTGPNTGPHPWLPFGGATASGHVQARHEARYHAEPGLGADDLKIRRAAREALRRLAIAFHVNGLARSLDEAKQLACEFSLIANAHADCRRLKRLSELLQSMLLSAAREHRTGEIAMACLDFAASRDFDSLERGLQEQLSA